MKQSNDILAKWFIAFVFCVLCCATSSAKSNKNAKKDISQACEGLIKIELSQFHYSLNIWKHAADAINTVTFTMPVSCRFYDTVNVGTNLLDHDNFRMGSFILHGSIGTWSLTVTEKLGKRG